MEMPIITNSEIKRIKSLSSKKFRDEFHQFVVEGDKMTSEALTSGLKVDSIYRTSQIGEQAMSRMTHLSSPSPSLAVVRMPENIELPSSDRRPIDDIIRKGGLFLALDSIRDPGNLGTILRIADWFGIDAVFASPDTVDIFNPKVVQATMGAIFRVKFHYVDIPSVCDSVLQNRGKVYGTFLDGEDLYLKDLSRESSSPMLIIIGNESNGISEAVSDKVSDRLYIPPYPQEDPGSESLNAAIATAITVAEFRRQSR